MNKHTNNILFLFNPKTEEWDLAPYFDHGSEKTYVVNYITGFNKQFSPNPEGYITREELAKEQIIKEKEEILWGKDDE